MKPDMKEIGNYYMRAIKTDAWCFGHLILMTSEKFSFTIPVGKHIRTEYLIRWDAVHYNYKGELEDGYKYKTWGFNEDTIAINDKKYYKYNNIYFRDGVPEEVNKYFKKLLIQEIIE
jgi:hypothetical protein